MLTHELVCCKRDEGFAACILTKCNSPSVRQNFISLTFSPVGGEDIVKPKLLGELCSAYVSAKSSSSEPKKQDRRGSCR